MDRCHGHGDLLVADVSAVCIGYIFFRAESVHQAFAMLKALVSPHGYTHWNLDPSFYMLTLLAAGGYFAVIGAVFYSIIWRRPRTRQETAPGRLSNWLGILANERWV